MNSEKQYSLKYVSERLGVSVSTISRILSGQARKYRISRETEKRVREFAKKVNFTPNLLAKSLRLKRNNTIGLVIPDVGNPFFANIANEIIRLLRAEGFLVILCDSEDDGSLEKQSLELLWNYQVEGIILCPVGQSSEHLLGYAEENRPLVVVDRVFPGLNLPYVGSDNFGGALGATEYLLKNGHRRIACLRGLCGTALSQARVDGFRAAFRKRGLQADESLIVGDSFGEQSGYRDTKILLRSGADITAIFAMSNLLALGALRALAEEKKKVPGDISLLAFDEQPHLAHLTPPLTTVAQSERTLGMEAVKLLLERMRAPENTHCAGISLPTSLIIRKSVRKLETAPAVL